MSLRKWLSVAVAMAATLGFGRGTDGRICNVIPNVGCNTEALLGPTAKDYVQEGLIAMWDGIENAGYGVHDPSAATWKDLGGNGIDLADGVALWSENAFVLDGSNYLTTENTAQIRTAIINYKNTSVFVEIVGDFVRHERYDAIFGSSPASTLFRCWCGYGSMKIWLGSGYATPNINNVAVKGHSAFALYGSNGYKTTYRNAVSLETIKTWAADTPALTQIGVGFDASYVPAVGNIHRIAIYANNNIDAVLQHNYAIDKKRFNLP